MPVTWTASWICTNRAQYSPFRPAASPPAGRPSGRYTQICWPAGALDGETGLAIRNGDIAITSTVRAGNATVEVARRQSDGTWLWLIDQPSVLE